MPVPADPKIYHIVHIDRLPSIIAENALWCCTEVARRSLTGIEIGMETIKQRRLKTPLSSHPDLHVGGCVPFFLCPRPLMLYTISKANHREAAYRGGQEPILHLEADLRQTVDRAEEHGQRWVFTLGAAGTRYFEDRCDLEQLDEIDWNSLQDRKLSGMSVTGIDSSVREHRHAEFLIEKRFPWELVSRIGVKSMSVYQQVRAALQSSAHKPPVEIRRDWYY